MRGNASWINAPGLSRACSRFVSRSLRRRSSSDGRKRGPQRDVRHQRQRIAQLRHRHRQPHRRIIERARRRQVGAEELERVREIERRSRTGAFVEHGGGEAADTKLADRICGAARTHDQVDLRERHLVMLDDPHREAVRQLLFLDRRQLERRRRADGRRLGAIGFLLRAERHGHGRRQQQSQDGPDPAIRSLKSAIISSLLERRSARRGDPSASSDQRRP